MRILSDANRFFIETILDHHGIKDYFTEIHTNTGYVDEVGRVRIFPHHDYTTTPHGCPNQLCPPNMCKVYISLFFYLNIIAQNKNHVSA